MRNSDSDEGHIRRNLGAYSGGISGVGLGMKTSYDIQRSSYARYRKPILSAPPRRPKAFRVKAGSLAAAGLAVGITGAGIGSLIDKARSTLINKQSKQFHTRLDRLTELNSKMDGVINFVRIENNDDSHLVRNTALAGGAVGLGAAGLYTAGARKAGVKWENLGSNLYKNVADKGLNPVASRIGSGYKSAVAKVAEALEKFRK